MDSKVFIVVTHGAVTMPTEKTLKKVAEVAFEKFGVGVDVREVTDSFPCHTTIPINRTGEKWEPIAIVHAKRPT